MRATIHQVQKKNYHWIIALALFVIPIVIEFLFGEKLYDLTHKSIIEVQKSMYDVTHLKVFDNTEDSLEDKKDNINNTEHNNTFQMSYLLSYISESSDTENKTVDEIFITEFIHILNCNGFYIFLCSFLYNFMNIYKIFILYMTIFLSTFLSSTLSYIFQFPRPYMAFYKIKSVAFFNEWGSPNNQLILLIAFSCSFYKVVVANKVCDKKLWSKIVIAICLILYSLFDAFLLFASGNLTYNQMIISACLAFVIFVFIFYCFPIELNKPKQFYDFMKFKSYYWIAINLLILAFQILLSIFITDRRDTVYYDNNIKTQAKRLVTNEFTEDYCKYRTLFSLNNGNLCNVICFLMNIILFISVRLEIRLIYGNTYNSWSEGNFEIPKIGGGLVDGDQGGLAEYNSIEKSQWNHNKCGIVFLRAVIDFIINLAIFVFFIWVTHFSEDEIILFIFLITLPMIISIFGNVYLFKAVYIKMNLARKPKIKMKNLLY